MLPQKQHPSAVKLQLGAFCPPLSEQLAGFVSAEDGKLFDADSDAIFRAYVRGYITDREIVSARKKLLERIQIASLKQSLP